MPSEIPATTTLEECLDRGDPLSSSIPPNNIIDEEIGGSASAVSFTFATLPQAPVPAVCSDGLESGALFTIPLTMGMDFGLPAGATATPQTVQAATAAAGL